MGESRKMKGGVHTRSQAAAKAAKKAAAELARTQRATEAANRNVATHPATRGRSVWTRDPFANLPDAFVADMARRVTAAPDGQSNARTLLSLNRATTSHVQGVLTDRLDRARVGLLVGFLRCVHRLFAKNIDIGLKWNASNTWKDQMTLQFHTVWSTELVVKSPSQQYDRYITLLTADQLRALAAAVDGAVESADNAPVMQWWGVLLSTVPNLKHVWDAVKRWQVVERMVQKGHDATIEVNFHLDGAQDIHMGHIFPMNSNRRDLNVCSIVYDDGAHDVDGVYEERPFLNAYVNEPSFDAFRDKICALAPPYRISIELLNIGACVRAFAAVLKGPEEEWVRAVMRMRFPTVTCPARGGRARKQK